MKRLATLLLLAILSFNTVGFTQSNSTAGSAATDLADPPAMLDPGPLALSIPGHNAVCQNIGANRVCASVSDAKVTPKEYVTVYGLLKKRGVPQQGKIMKVIWRSHGTATCTGFTDENGLASCRAYFRGAEKGHKVRVKVTIGRFNVTTYFTSR